MQVDKACDLDVGFDDKFKADNHILCVVLRVNGIIDWVVKKLISAEANTVLKIQGVGQNNRNT